MISVIIPALDAESVKPLISSIKNNLQHHPHEILVQSEKGYLNAISSGIKRARGEIIIIMDGDGSHNPKYLTRMLSLIEKADIVIGSRYTYGGYSNDIFIRRMISRFFCKIARVLLGFPQIADVMSGFIMVKKEVLNNIRLDAYGYKIGLSILMQAKGKYRIAECPIIFEKSYLGDYVKPRNIKDAVQTLIFITKLFILRITNMI